MKIETLIKKLRKIAESGGDDLHWQCQEAVKASGLLKDYWLGYLVGRTSRYGDCYGMTSWDDGLRDYVDEVREVYEIQEGKQ